MGSLVWWCVLYTTCTGYGSNNDQNNKCRRPASPADMIILLLALLTTASSAQTVSYTYRDAADSTRNCYLAYVPEGHVKGLVVRDYTRLSDTSSASPCHFTDLMLERGWAVVYTATSTVYPDLYYHDGPIAQLDSIIHEVLTIHNISADAIVIGGISASGARALRYTQWCEQGKSPFGHRVAGAFAVDPPLDLERFFNSSAAILQRDDPKSTLDEANLMVAVLPQQLGGSPSDAYEAYLRASVYTASDPEGGNAKWLVDVPVRMYHEPDIDWWLEERSASYEDINSVDIAGLVKQVRFLGGTKIELVTTTGKGFDRQGNRKPHSWTIVDEHELAEWVDGLVP